MEVDITEDLYPGHTDPEVSTFAYDKTENKIRHRSSLVANDECTRLVKSRVDNNSIQLIRFRTLTGLQAPVPSPGQKTADIAAIQTVLETLHFPKWPIIAAAQDNRLQMGRHYDQYADDETPVFYGCGSRFCVIWVNYIKDRSVRVVMVNFMLLGSSLDKLLLQLLAQRIMPEFQTCFTHPMFFTLSMIHMIEWDTLSTYTQDDTTLRRIENTFVTVRSAGRIKTMEALRDLGRLASRDKYTLTSLGKFLDLARRVDEEYIGKGPGQQDDRMNKKQFFWHAARLDDTIALDVAFLNSILESVQNQQSALTSIVNLQDTSAMKTIAIITMTFLPASFVAALFSMSMFQWNEAEGRIVSRQFWIYWAVVLPLTFIVFTIWLVWWNWNWLTKRYNAMKAELLLGGNKSTINNGHDTDGTTQASELDRVRRFENDYWTRNKSGKDDDIPKIQGV